MERNRLERFWKVVTIIGKLQKEMPSDLKQFIAEVVESYEFKDKDIFTTYYLDERKIKQIANERGVTPAAIDRRIKRVEVDVAAEYLYRFEGIKINGYDLRKAGASYRSVNMLLRRGVYEVQDLCSMTKEEAENINGIGRKGVNEIEDALSKMQLHFKE